MIPLPQNVQNVGDNLAGNHQRDGPPSTSTSAPTSSSASGSKDDVEDIYPATGPPAMSLPMPLDLTLRSSSLEFIDYYDKNLAGLMVWFDSEENDYRRRVLPLATSTPAVKYAVAAIAAHHGGRTFSLDMPRFPEAARDACLGLINRHIQNMTCRMTDGSELNTRTDIAEAEWILASILMISCYEMSNSQVAAAEGHRRAARTLVNVFTTKEASNRGLFRFLRNQLSIYDVLASTTSFNLQDIEDTVLPPPGTEHGLFSHYLSLLHFVTLLSRRAAFNMDTNSLILGNYPDATLIRSQFTQARGATLLAAGKLRIEPAVVRRDFVRLVDIYHHTAVLYSYRCLGYANYDNIDWKASVEKLFEQLKVLEDPALCAHNLPWPAFIAGAESHDDVAKQKVVTQLLRDITKTTGFKNHADILSFLTVFWAASNADWRPLAQQFQENGYQILPV
ncbi:Zn(2)-C6 fungal-type DNA-binding domain-containing protein [Pochonia chlamydosporia 170]|uniref:Zn(2)-C6 fungal-type DNA-binding domain-containing protein n=1 Tax=Pochonia chlamydosporia 170 TaxID=1380566 RepID=A0A179FCN7_METCM|nr:Zn(2)-C6 fungal-type DNA-binding domain-containing protein [Pochonia chlamydosporia 170]OAQ62823.1 Zn(2)-C6 fungal-type DNA-binding domain-containing protein [Pochonia chlamydosporia 170]